MAKVLIIEDEKAIVDIIAFNLKREGYQTEEAYDGQEGLRLALQPDVDLVLLDVMLPLMDGFELLRRLREKSNVPVIMVTAREEERDKVFGLESGADDYITKPFSLAVLRARVANQLRRSRPAASLWQIGPYRFDFEAMEFSREGRPIVLSPTEQKLLRLLVENRGRTLPRERLLDRIWADAAFVEPNALSVTVKRLRDKLEDPGYIKTVYGVGYSWAVEP